MKMIKLLINLVIVIKLISANIITKCPDYQIHFEKILGFRPPTISTQSTNYGTTLEEKVLYKASYQLPSVINLQCMELCRNDRNCESYALNFNKSECYGFSSNERMLETHNLWRFDDHELVEDISVVYFVKTCLNIPLTCKGILWPLLRIPGSSLIGRGYLTINKLITRRECIERCLFETTFKCRSVSFQISQRNNIARMGLANILNRDVMGQCILSRDDKNTEPDSFRVAPIHDEYIENQCHVTKGGEENQFLDDLCAYEHYPESALIYAEREFIGLTDRHCQEKCFKEQKFFCKGLTYQKMEQIENSRCFIHSEDVVSMGPRAVISHHNSYYMKRVQCLNLNVRCTSDQMIIRYHPRQFFQGRIYAENHADECGVSGSNYGPTFLTLPIGSVLKEHRCGINRAFDYETPNRTLIFAYIIIQNNPLVMMQSDRYIKVGCITRVNQIGSGMPDYVSLETSFEFNNKKDYDGSGSLVIDTGGDIPKLNVYIIDAVDNIPVKEAKIGQMLKLIISMESHIDNYDLRAINLTATSEFDRLDLIGSTGCPKNIAIFPALQKESSNTSRRVVTKFKAFKFASSPQLRLSVKIQFCYKVCNPVNCGYGIISHGRKRRHTEQSAMIVTKGLGPIIFPDHIVTNGQLKEEVSSTTTTQAPLGSIRFPGPVHEKLISETQYLFGTKTENQPGIRVDTFGNPLGIQQYVADEENEVETDRLDKSREKIVTIPIDITLNIIEPDINGTDRLVIGENDQLLVAGLGSNDGLCLDQSLIIAIIIFWMMFQVIMLLGCCIMVRRYKKFSHLDDDRSSIDNHGYYPDSLENRHVRWADQSSHSHTDVYFR